MIQPILRLALEPSARRHRQLRLFSSLAIAWAVLAAISAGIWFSGYKGLLVAPAIAIGAGLTYWILRRRASAWEPDWHQVARAIERQNPKLHALLITAVEQQPDRKTGELHFLQQRVIQDAIAESRRHPWLNAVPRTRIFGTAVVQFAMLAALVFVLVQIEDTAVRAKREIAAMPAGPSIEVTPGDTEIEKGGGLVVLAKFDGELPSTATMILEPQNGPAQRIELTKNMDDPVFGGALPEITADLQYRIEYLGTETRNFKVRVFEHPRLERADAKLTYPDYTKLGEKEIADTRRVSAVQGSTLDLSLALNKPVKSAKLVPKEGEAIPLKVDSDKPSARLSGLRGQRQRHVYSSTRG